MNLLPSWYCINLNKVYRTINILKTRQEMYVTKLTKIYPSHFCFTQFHYKKYHVPTFAMLISYGHVVFPSDTVHYPLTRLPSTYHVPPLKQVNFMSSLNVYTFFEKDPKTIETDFMCSLSQFKRSSNKLKYIALTACMVNTTMATAMSSNNNKYEY